VADLLPGPVFASAAFVSREWLWFPGLLSASFVLPSKNFPCPHSVLGSCPGPFSCESFNRHAAWFACHTDLSARFPAQAWHDIFIFPFMSRSASWSRNQSTSPDDSYRRFFFPTMSRSYSRAAELDQALVFVDLVPSPSFGSSRPKIWFFIATRADFFSRSPRQGPAGLVLLSCFDFCALSKNLIEAHCPGLDFIQLFLLQFCLPPVQLCRCGVLLVQSLAV
jgi:hypothetical protein